MTAKEYLRQYINAKNRFKSISDEMIEIRSAATRITPVISDMPSDSHVNDKIALSVERLDECAKKLEEEAKRMQKAMDDVQNVINSVSNPTYRQVLTYRYINSYTWEQIAVVMNYSYVHICRLHGYALKVAKDVIECYIETC